MVGDLGRRSQPPLHYTTSIMAVTPIIVTITPSETPALNCVDREVVIAAIAALPWLEKNYLSSPPQVDRLHRVQVHVHSQQQGKTNGDFIPAAFALLAYNIRHCSSLVTARHPSKHVKSSLSLVQARQNSSKVAHHSSKHDKSYGLVNSRLVKKGCPSSNNIRSRVRFVKQIILF